MPRPLLALIVLILALSAAIPVQAQMTTTGILSSAAGWYLRTSDSAGELFVFELGAGTGDPVVVLHGGPGGDLTYMLPIANGLESDFRFVFYDQRGSLRSRALPDSITMPKHVADLEQLRLALGTDRIRIVSHSAGTMLAYEYLQTHPDQVSNLVLVGALPHKNGGRYYDAEYTGFWKGLSDSANAFSGRTAVRDEIRRARLDRADLTPRERGQLALIRQVGAESYRVDRWREAIPVRVQPEAARRMRSTTNFTYDAGPLLARHPYRVTVINGEFDYTVGPRNSPLWRRLVETTAPKVKLVVISEASHLVWRDSPERFRVSLREALESRE